MHKCGDPCKNGCRRVLVPDSPKPFAKRTRDDVEEIEDVESKEEQRVKRSNNNKDYTDCSFRELVIQLEAAKAEIAVWQARAQKLRDLIKEWE